MSEAETEAVRIAKLAADSAAWLGTSHLIQVSQALLNVVGQRDELLVSVDALAEAIADGSLERDKLAAERDRWRDAASSEGKPGTIAELMKRARAAGHDSLGIMNDAEWPEPRHTITPEDIHLMLAQAVVSADDRLVAICRVALDPILVDTPLRHMALGLCAQRYSPGAKAPLPELPDVRRLPCRYEIVIHEPGKGHNWVWSTHNDYERACAAFEDYADLACEREPKDLPGTLVELRDLGEDRRSSMTINDMTST